MSPNGPGGGASGGAGPARARARAVMAPNTATQCHLDLDDGFHAAHPAQDDPAAAAGGDVARSPAGHRLAAHRLPGRGERGQVRGGLGAVAPADGTRPARAPRTAPRPGPRRRSPPTRSPSRGPPHRTGSTACGRPATSVCHGPPPVVDTSACRRRGAGRYPTARRARFLVRAPPPPGRDVDGQQPHRCGRHLADRLVAAHRQLDAGTGRCQACRDGPPAVRLAAGGQPDQLAGGVRAAHRRRPGADRAERERGDQR